MDNYVNIVDEQALAIQSNILDNLGVYEEHYISHNQELLLKAQEMWDKMHMERTNMLWSKEEYLNSMHSY